MVKGNSRDETDCMLSLSFYVAVCLTGIKSSTGALSVAQYNHLHKEDNGVGGSSIVRRSSGISIPVVNSSRAMLIVRWSDWIRVF